VSVFMEILAPSNLADCDKAYHTALLASDVALHMIVHGHGREGCGFPSPPNLPRRADSFGCLLSSFSARTSTPGIFAITGLMPPACTSTPGIFAITGLMPPAFLEYTTMKLYTTKTKRYA